MNSQTFSLALLCTLFLPSVIRSSDVVEALKAVAFIDAGQAVEWRVKRSILRPARPVVEPSEWKLRKETEKSRLLAEEGLSEKDAALQVENTIGIEEQMSNLPTSIVLDGKVVIEMVSPLLWSASTQFNDVNQAGETIPVDYFGSGGGLYAVVTDVLDSASGVKVSDAVKITDDATSVLDELAPWDPGWWFSRNVFLENIVKIGTDDLVFKSDRFEGRAVFDRENFKIKELEIKNGTFVQQWASLPNSYTLKIENGMGYSETMEATRVGSRSLDIGTAPPRIYTFPPKGQFVSIIEIAGENLNVGSEFLQGKRIDEL